MLFSGPKTSYFDEYERKKDTNRNMQNPPTLLTDRSAYVNFLEVQLERVSNACLHIQSYDSKFSDMQNLFVNLESRCNTTTKLISLAQQCSEEFRAEGISLIEKLKEERNEERSGFVSLIEKMSARIALLENKIISVESIDSRVNLLEAKYHALEEQKTQSDLHHFAELSANKTLTNKLQNDICDLALQIKQLETQISRSAFDTTEEHNKLKINVNAVELRLNDQIKQSISGLDEKIHAMDAKHNNTYELIHYAHTQNNIHIDNQLMKLSQTFSTEVSKFQSKQTELTSHVEALAVEVSDLKAYQKTQSIAERNDMNYGKQLEAKMDECVRVQDNLQTQLFALQETFISQLQRYREQQYVESDSESELSFDGSKHSRHHKSTSSSRKSKLHSSKRKHAHSHTLSGGSRSDSDPSRTSSTGNLKRSTGSRHSKGARGRLRTQLQQRLHDERQSNDESEPDTLFRSYTTECANRATERMLSANKSRHHKNAESSARADRDRQSKERLSVEELQKSTSNSKQEKYRDAAEFHALLASLIQQPGESSSRPPHFTEDQQRLPSAQTEAITARPKATSVTNQGRSRTQRSRSSSPHSSRSYLLSTIASTNQTARTDIFSRPVITPLSTTRHSRRKSRVDKEKVEQSEASQGAEALQHKINEGVLHTLVNILTTLGPSKKEDNTDSKVNRVMSEDDDSLQKSADGAQQQEDEEDRGQSESKQDVSQSGPHEKKRIRPREFPHISDSPLHAAARSVHNYTEYLHRTSTPNTNTTHTSTKSSSGLYRGGRRHHPNQLTHSMDDLRSFLSEHSQNMSECRHSVDASSVQNREGSSGIYDQCGLLPWKPTKLFQSSGGAKPLIGSIVSKIPSSSECKGPIIQYAGNNIVTKVMNTTERHKKSSAQQSLPHSTAKKTTTRVLESSDNHNKAVVSVGVSTTAINMLDESTSVSSQAFSKSSHEINNSCTEQSSSITSSQRHSATTTSSHRGSGSTSSGTSIATDNTLLGSSVSGDGGRSEVSLPSQLFAPLTTAAVPPLTSKAPVRKETKVAREPARMPLYFVQ